MHLLSKLTVLFLATISMTCIHLLATLLSDLLLPYIGAANYPLANRTQLSTVVMVVAVNLLMIGGALAVSAWLNSNGAPILCGLLTPLVLVSIIRLLSYLLEIPLTDEEYSSRFAVAATVVGAFLVFCGSYWYVNRVEP